MSKKKPIIYIELNDPELGHIVLDGSKEAEKELDERIDEHYRRMHGDGDNDK